MERHAAQAALEYIKDDMTIGLGSGKAVEYLVEFISMEHFKNLKVVANRMNTALLAQKRGLNVIPCWMVDHLDYTFDTLDYMVKDLSGAKSNTTVIVEDKLLASMADKLIYMVNKNSLVEVLATGFPVEVEVIKPALAFVSKRLSAMKAQVYDLSPDRKEPFISSDGNYIIEARFKDIQDIKALSLAIESIPGVVSTSLFTDLNATALVYSPDKVETINNFTGDTEAAE